jgi:hypothetical protein
MLCNVDEYHPGTNTQMIYLWFMLSLKVRLYFNGIKTFFLALIWTPNFREIGGNQCHDDEVNA